MIGRDCRCPGCGTCDAASEVGRLRGERDEARAHTSTAAFMRVERQRDEARAQVTAGQAEELARRTERDVARAEVSRREREHGALVETAQKALENVAAERDEALYALDSEKMARYGREMDALDDLSEARAEVERLRNDLARCREVQKATAEGWRHEVAEVAAIVGAPAHTAELAACVRAEVERLREALRAIAAGFDPITGSVVDGPSAKQVDGYYRGYAMAALEKAAQR